MTKNILQEISSNRGSSNEKWKNTSMSAKGSKNAYCILSIKIIKKDRVILI